MKPAQTGNGNGLQGVVFSGVEKICVCIFWFCDSMSEMQHSNFVRGSLFDFNCTYECERHLCGRLFTHNCGGKKIIIHGDGMHGGFNGCSSLRLSWQVCVCSAAKNLLHNPWV